MLGSDRAGGDRAEYRVCFFSYEISGDEGWGEGIYRHIDAGDLWSCPGISASPDIQQDEKPS